MLDLKVNFYKSKLMEVVRTFFGGPLQILEQKKKMMKNMINIAHKFQSACITLSFRFDSPHQFLQTRCKWVITGESPSGYFGNLDMVCTLTSSISINDSLQNKVSSIPLVH
jgi:hypothetical protein